MGEENILVILHIYFARAIFLILCDPQDAKSDACEIEISISQPIFTQKYISKSLWYQDIHTI